MDLRVDFSNVLFVGPNYQNHRGGMGAVLATYSSKISKFKFLNTYNSNISGFQNQILFAKSLFRLILFFARDRKIKIVHLHSASNGSFYRKYIIFVFSKLFRKKVVFHLHGAEFHLFYKKSNFFSKRLVKNLYANSDHIICLSKFWYDFISVNFQPKALSIVNNPVEFGTIINPNSEKDKVHLLFLGKIGGRKGIFDLLQVISQNRDRFRDKLILHVGGDGDIDRFNQFISTQKLEELVNYVGWVDSDSKSKLLQQSDALILPSYNEGLPIAILEAMSYGKAIIATKVGGIPEVVKDKVNGYLINPGDLEGISNSINQLIDNPFKLKTMGNQSADIVKRYHIDIVLDHLLSIYNNLKLNP